MIPGKRVPQEKELVSASCFLRSPLAAALKRARLRGLSMRHYGIEFEITQHGERG